MFEIVIGRNEGDRKRYGDNGIFLLGKHYVKMGQTTSLSANIFMDAVRPHVVFVVGKRGSGKSYTSGAMFESMMCMSPDVVENLSLVMIDTMGIFWTMKFENTEDAQLLKQWQIGYRPINVQVFTPKGYFAEFKEKGISDFPFSLRTSELSINDWLMTFELGMNDPVALLISRAIANVQVSVDNYSIQDIISAIRKDKNSDKHSMDAAENLFLTADGWGLFDTEGTKISELCSGGQITVLDVSCYAALSGVSGIRALVVGLVCKKLFEERMSVRRLEEYNKIKAKLSVEDTKTEHLKLPLVWIAIDEAHEFLPRLGKTAATDALLTLLREGRQPGVSLVLATQQPAQIHTDVMTQSDIVIAHRLTAKIDIDSLGLLMQSYMREGIDKMFSQMPDTKGAAVIFDDTNERLFLSQVRPKMTWHGGSSPSAISEKKRMFELIK